jgi:hypothetical protein
MMIYVVPPALDTRDMRTDIDEEEQPVRGVQRFAKCGIPNRLSVFLQSGTKVIHRLFYQGTRRIWNDSTIGHVNT